MFLAAKPLHDIRHLAGVHAVLVRGHYLDAAARQKRLDTLRTAASNRGRSRLDPSTGAQ